MTFEQQLIEYGAEREAKGIKTGTKIGIKKGKEQMINAMLMEGFSPETIAKYAKGYSVNQIEQMRCRANTMD